MTKGLKKMFERRGALKKKHFSGPVNLTSAVTQDVEINPHKKPTYSEGQRRRAHQVGRVLYDNIVQLVNSGQLCPQLAAMSVEIVQVKVVPNFSSVNVYWLASGSEEDQVVEELFKEHEGLLRQMLTSQHILGAIPRINFIRDDSRARYLEVESLLSKADFGPDFEPTRLDTSIRDIFLAQRLKEGSNVDQLQKKFDQLSHKSYTAKVDFLSSEALPKTQFDDSSGVKETSNKKSNESPETHKCDGENTNTDQKEHLRNQPFTLEVEQLHSQFFSGSSADEPTNKKENPEQKTNFTGLGPLKTDSMCKGFRDDLYGVPHTQLLNKVMLRKQKAGTRLADIRHERQAEALQLKLEPRSLKTLLHKKARSKGRLESQSDFVKAGIRSLNETDRSAGEEAEEFSDDDFENVTHTGDYPPTPKP